MDLLYSRSSFVKQKTTNNSGFAFTTSGYKSTDISIHCRAKVTLGNIDTCLHFISLFDFEKVQVIRSKLHSQNHCCWSSGYRGSLGISDNDLASGLIMACRLLDVEPIFKPMLIYCINRSRKNICQWNFNKDKSFFTKMSLLYHVKHVIYGQAPRH